MVQFVDLLSASESCGHAPQLLAQVHSAYQVPFARAASGAAAGAATAEEDEALADAALREAGYSPGAGGHAAGVSGGDEGEEAAGDDDSESDSDSSNDEEARARCSCPQLLFVPPSPGIASTI